MNTATLRYLGIQELEQIFTYLSNDEKTVAIVVKIDSRLLLIVKDSSNRRKRKIY